jgi:hypothetical protein
MMALKDNATAPKTPTPPSPPNPNPKSLHADALCVLVATTTTLDTPLHLVLLHQALHRHALHLFLKVKLSDLSKASSLKVGQWQVRAGKWEDASSLRRNLLFVSAGRAAVMLPHLELGVAAWECRRWRLGDRLLLALQNPLWRLGVQALPLCSDYQERWHVHNHCCPFTMPQPQHVWFLSSALQPAS